MIRRLSALAAAGFLSACGVFASPPAETALTERLAAFPTAGLDFERPTEIRWNDHQVPYILAETDDDAAYALGLVHAHLRLAQMEAFKRIAQGRISEMAGPLTTEIDIALRAVGFGRASAEILAGMPPESRRWLDRYVAGVNAYKAHAEETRLPHEFEVLGLENEPWTAEDTIAVGRLTGTDVNWIVLFGLLPYADDPRFDAVLRFIVDAGSGSPPPATDNLLAAADIPRTEDNPLLRMARLTEAIGRTGSNSLVIDETRSATGAPLIANDPHLGFTIPNAWIVAGLRSPSYRTVGMMVPGIPAFGFGRNPTLAWGGTNLRSLNSDLIDVSDLPPDAFTEERHEIGVRFWFDETAVTRMSPYGPVVSDAADVPLYKGRSFALRWIGHRPSDEITALLNAMKAPDWDAFRAAMPPFALPAQNFLVADANGRIGHLIATHIPVREPEDRYGPIVVSPETAERTWSRILTADTLPMRINPVEGYLASSNNRPFANGPMIGRFFSQDERVRRLRQLADSTDRVSLDDLAAWQRDVYSPLSVALTEALLRRAGNVEDPVLDALSTWDGRYETDSHGAAVFEAFLTGFAEAAYGLDTENPGVLAVVAGRGYTRSLVLRDLPGLTEEQWRTALTAGLAKARPTVEAGAVWGERHRLQVRHLLANLPLIGGAYVYNDVPMPGSRETVLKSSHDLTAERHDASFGSQSRHLSDLSDPDANYFVLLGGQDGWIGSTTALDQVGMWRRGEAIQMPLTPAAVLEKFPHGMRILP